MDGIEFHARHGAGPYSKVFCSLNKHNILVKAHLWYVSFYDGMADFDLVSTLVFMCRSGSFVPDPEWAVHPGPVRRSLEKLLGETSVRRQPPVARYGGRANDRNFRAAREERTRPLALSTILTLCGATQGRLDPQACSSIWKMITTPVRTTRADVQLVFFGIQRAFGEEEAPAPAAPDAAGATAAAAAGGAVATSFRQDMHPELLPLQLWRNVPVAQAPVEQPP